MALHLPQMLKRKRWILSALAIVIVMIAIALLSGSEQLGLANLFGAGGQGEIPWAPGVFGAGSAADGGLGGSGELAAQAVDGGYGAGPPMGTWLPTASVSEDPASPDGSLTGRVISSRDGSAIAGAELMFLHEGASSSVRSGVDGTFALQVSETGRYVLAIATAEGFLPFAPEWGHSPISFQARAHQRLDGALVHLSPMVQTTIVVVDSEKAPVMGANVELLGAGIGQRAMAPVQASFRTDESGRVRVAGWPGALVEASHAEHGRGRGRLRGRLRGRGGATEEIQIELDASLAEQVAGEPLGGVVIDEHGRPIEGVRISAYRQQRGMHPSSQGSSDAEGRFEIDGLDPGAHRLVANHPDHPQAQVGGVRTGTQNARITMRSGLSLSGRVVDGDGAPVPAFTILARMSRGALMRRNVARVSSYDTDGRFEFTGLSAGDLELVATARGLPPSAPVPVSVRPGGSVPVTITLAAGGRIEGIVLSSADATPIAGATISLEERLGRSNSAVPLLARGVSDAEGHYSLEGIGDTLSSIRVHAEGHHSRILAGLAIEPGSTRNLNVELTPVEEGEESHTELAGIGVVLMPRGDTLMIGRIVEGGGAHAAELHRGDVIVAVDGTPVTTLGFGGSIDHIRGQEGSQVTLSVRRQGSADATQVVITRMRVRT